MNRSEMSNYILVFPTLIIQTLWDIVSNVFLLYLFAGGTLGRKDKMDRLTLGIFQFLIHSLIFLTYQVS